MSAPTKLITFQHAVVSSAFSAIAVFGAKAFSSKDILLGFKFGWGIFISLLFIFFLFETFAPPPNKGKFNEDISITITVVILFGFVLGSAGYVLNSLAGLAYGLGILL